ncbi:Cof-type HAD-IIB family hydrolase [Saliterribacillus persicus]|uniref:Cof subfamily protein (Haloacid dehalogenase superfamily)/HAD superfamily hydrolase (TIGR01484 family) n=1 Tax=Saliterribacillus persicus TaxID=930114 RepID=A0A368XPK6_9BACI|nr:Cof-type HAD-IIB family hydrolase [Saliterribacillus persicus]RCW69795.1 hypothetical protein DFR57_107185 [Saliterribacillus persicus]
MKLIATDLDGTLLNEEHQISKENAKALQLAKDHGIEVIVATGRSYEAAKKPLAEVSLKCPIICLNGAKVHDLNEEILKTAPLEKESCMKISQICHKENIYIEVFTNKGGFSESREVFIKVMVDIALSANADVDPEIVRARAMERFQDEEIEITNDLNEVFGREDIEVYKILAFSIDDQQLKRVHEQLKEDELLAITSSGHSNLEFNHPEAQKGIALKWFANKLGIDMIDVMAIGDNLNDLSMIEMAGHGVAMGNAEELIKNSSNFITLSNKENGVAHAIENMIKTLQT